MLLKIYRQRLRKNHGAFRGPDECLELCQILHEFNAEKARDMNLPQNSYQVENYVDEIDLALPIPRCRYLVCINRKFVATKGVQAKDLIALVASQEKIAGWWKGQYYYS